jgi:GTP-binding protein
MGEYNIPFVMVFTKTDKLNNHTFLKNMKRYEEIMLETWEELPPRFYTSSVKKSGTEEILEFVGQTNEAFNEK